MLTQREKYLIFGLLLVSVIFFIFASSQTQLFVDWNNVLNETLGNFMAAVLATVMTILIYNFLKRRNK